MNDFGTFLPPGHFKVMLTHPVPVGCSMAQYSGVAVSQLHNDSRIHHRPIYYAEANGVLNWLKAASAI